ncbi:DUF5593 domain-containing protein [Nocardia uniformis]|uniref:DUF5593 domain-containing protein n=1 Tax=Nocardia uniformis TaxID=53432 RepID=A0A849C3F4_9NOCA|nr:GAF domain-containing protein [Nocardia uniformis]NNH69499.1 DUF5593 domain-containing protein [Nocardia uniformis]
MIPWVTVETLVPSAMSVATIGGDQRDFASVRRVLQRVLKRTPALYDSLTTHSVIEALHATRCDGKALDLEVPTTTGPHVLQTRPVLGPTDEVHAVQLWIGPAGVPVEPPRAVGAVWDLDTQVIRQPSAVTALRGISVEEYVPTMSIAELFQRTAVFDRHGEVLDLLYNPGRDDKLQFDLDLAPVAGRPAGRWRLTVRAREQGAWMLIEDVSSASPLRLWPTLEQVGLREAHRRAGTHLAVIQLEHTSISHWLTDSAPWIRWEYLYRPVDVFHPQDRERIAAVQGLLATGVATEVTVRTLSYSGSYVPTTIRLYPYPGFSRSQLVLGEVLLADSVGYLSAGSAGPAQPESSTRLGYDEHLSRHRVDHPDYGRAS